MTHKILLVISKYPPEYSGPGVRISRLYEWLIKGQKSYNVSVLCNGIEHTKGETYMHNGFPVKRVGLGRIGELLSFIFVIPERYKRSVLSQIDFMVTLFTFAINKSYRDIDLFHVAGHSGSTTAALLWAHIKNKPVLLELVTADAPHRQRFFFAFKTPIIKRQKVIALTHEMKEKCLRNGLPKDQIWCRPNPIDELNFFIPSKMQKDVLRRQLSPFGSDHVILASVAKIMPQKNQFLILKSLTHLPEKFVALIAGPMVNRGPLYERDNGYFEAMKSFIKENNLEHRVHLVNDFVNAKDYMKASDIYMMPAWNEGFGTPMIEALGCGLPVVANRDEPAFQEWIENEENGALCDIECPEEWAKAIVNIELFSESKRRNISEYAHRKAGQTSIYAQYQHIIQNLLSKDI